MSASKGTALVTVLWVVAVISIVSFTLAASVRVEVDSTSDSFDSERAFYMAKGAAETVFSSVSTNTDVATEHSPIRLEKGEYIFRFDGGEARVRKESEGSQIDINTASDRLLASLFDSVGVSQETRNRLVDSVLDWRDPDDIQHLYGAEIGDYTQVSDTDRLPRNAPFASRDELLLVKNMTPELYYGRFISSGVNGEFRRIPGLRELISTKGGEKVDINAASFDVLLALPDVSPAMANRIVELRNQRLFDNEEDLTKRIPDMTNSETLKYVRFDADLPTALVSTATITNSKVSRSVRIVFTRTPRIQILSLDPLYYRRLEDLKFDRWQNQ